MVLLLQCVDSVLYPSSVCLNHGDFGSGVCDGLCSTRKDEKSQRIYGLSSLELDHINRECLEDGGIKVEFIECAFPMQSTLKRGTRAEVDLITEVHADLGLNEMCLECELGNFELGPVGLLHEMEPRVLMHLVWIIVGQIAMMKLTLVSSKMLDPST